MKLRTLFSAICLLAVSIAYAQLPGTEGLPIPSSPAATPPPAAPASEPEEKGPLSAEERPLDGVWEKVTTEDKMPIVYDHIREADAFWSKRIWRTIDVREKLNLPYGATVEEPLIKIVHELAKNGDVRCFENLPNWQDSGFAYLMDVEALSKIGQRRDTITQIDPITMMPVQKIIDEQLTYDKIVQYKLKEDWFFDENTSTYMVRILGIAPVMEEYSSDGVYIGLSVMYWVYYPDLRDFLAKKEAYNPGNDAVRLSWEDMFEARIFSSFIYKESNVFNREIAEYVTGLDALLESERVKKDLFIREHDLWTY